MISYFIYKSFFLKNMMVQFFLYLFHRSIWSVSEMTAPNVIGALANAYPTQIAHFKNDRKKIYKPVSPGELQEATSKAGLIMQKDIKEYTKVLSQNNPYAEKCAEKINHLPRFTLDVANFWKNNLETFKSIMVMMSVCFPRCRIWNGLHRFTLLGHVIQVARGVHQVFHKVLKKDTSAAGFPLNVNATNDCYLRPYHYLHAFQGLRNTEEFESLYQVMIISAFIHDVGKIKYMENGKRFIYNEVEGHEEGGYKMLVGEKDVKFRLGYTDYLVQMKDVFSRLNLTPDQKNKVLIFTRFHGSFCDFSPSGNDEKNWSVLEEVWESMVKTIPNQEVSFYKQTFAELVLFNVLDIAGSSSIDKDETMPWPLSDPLFDTPDRYGVPQIHVLLWAHSARQYELVEKFLTSKA